MKLQVFHDNGQLAEFPLDKVTGLQVTVDSGETLADEVNTLNSNLHALIDKPGVAPVTGTETVTVTDNTPLITQPAADPTPPDSGATDSTPPAPTVDSTSDSGSPTSEPSAPDPAPDPVVADAQTAVQAVQDAPPETTPQLLADAQTDVAAALEQWPDSPALQDLKAKLDQLAADS